jgi:hypothetical protein
MKDFETIRLICEENSKISDRVVDEFLINYAAGRNNLEHEMNVRFAAYKHITQKFQKEWVNMLKSQYITHKIFKKGGLVKTYLNHPALNKLKLDERKYLEFQAENPWRFSFSVIKGNPAESFYIMEDVFREEEFLIYSPGITVTLKAQPVILWFNMIAFNGSCWQSYGPIGAYRSFEPDDIFFFATELRPDIENEEELLENLENNPLPYLMLLCGANYPLIANKKDQMLHVMAEYDIENLDTKSLTAGFKTEYNKGIYRLSLRKWSEHPHFAQAYYNEKNKKITLSSMTDRGFKAPVKGLNEYGYDFESDPFVRVNLTMLKTASDILKRKIDALKYDHLFSKESSPAVKEGVEKLNIFLNLAMPDINSGLQPDIDALAAKAGIDRDTAKELIAQIDKKLKGNDSHSKRKKK